MLEITKIRELKGVGEKTEKLFAKLGLFSVGDLLRYFPRGYDIFDPPINISDLEGETTATIMGKISGRVSLGGSKSMQITTTRVKDKTGEIRVVWFHMPYLRNTLSSGKEVVLRGKVKEQKNGTFVMEHPDVFSPIDKYMEKLNTMQPLYGLTKGLTNTLMIKVMKQVLSELDLSRESLPEFILEKYYLQGYGQALREIHFPTNKDTFVEARKRLVFEEFLQFLLSVRSMKEEKGMLPNEHILEARKEVDEFISKLPYQLTAAQMKVWKEVSNDISGSGTMSRLVQGDVGSGKTIIAILALMTAALNGYQGAMMAPTEVLARQHYEKITKMFEEYQIPIKVELVIGSMTAKEKRRAYDRVEIGLAKIIIGTHALIQEGIHYDNLALVVTDEQHRFGVKQREIFAEKGTSPHILVMSATPIPRTLAIILYGDLDISIIDELPANRLPIKNCVVDTTYRPTAYRFMKNEIQKGRQVYVICPMVEESEGMEAENVTDYSKMLQAEMGEQIVVDVLHGKMKPALKDQVMDRFARNETQILVSTTVIEVGIDVPNASVMMVENAERFGLAQLHQIRGRVGRGKHQSYCIFMTPSKAKETKERLDILNHSNDGFKIASEDLRLRGPGDLFGIRQSGIMDFKIGDIYQDAIILKQANEAVEDLTQRFPDLTQRLVTEANINIVI